MQAFKDGDIRFLIATDVAARGIDISGLPFLINMTLPDRTEDYIHRVGRVGGKPPHSAALVLEPCLVASPTNQPCVRKAIGSPPDVPQVRQGLFVGEWQRWGLSVSGGAGRAERLGLAISLVSQVEEKVWYCRTKGHKPWLKPSAQDVLTHEGGGHTIWYNELQLLKVGPLPPAGLTCHWEQLQTGSPVAAGSETAFLMLKSRTE